MKGILPLVIASSVMFNIGLAFDRWIARPYLRSELTKVEQERNAAQLAAKSAQTYARNLAESCQRLSESASSLLKCADPASAELSKAVGARGAPVEIAPFECTARQGIAGYRIECQAK